MDPVEDPMTTREFALIGQYVVTFEELLEMMRTTINSILRRNGLEDPDMQTIITTGLTSDPLQKVFRSFVLREVNLWEEPDSVKKNMISVVVEVIKRIKALTEQRNSVVHGTWEMGRGTFDPDVRIPMFGFRFKHTGEGLSGTLAPNPEQLEALIRYCEQTKTIIYRLHMALENPHVSPTLLSIRRINRKNELVLPGLPEH
jgi:hypothetical protein